MPDKTLVEERVEQAAGNSGIEGLFVTNTEKQIIAGLLMKYRGIATTEAYDQLLEKVMNPPRKEEGEINGFQRTLRRSPRRTI